MNEKTFSINCLQCETKIDYPVTAKEAVCQKCGFRHEVDAPATNERLKKLMKMVFGEKPDKPENN